MSVGAGLTRRQVMAGAALALADSSALAAGATRVADAPRVVALDWGWAATLVALGVAPVGVAERRSYARWVRTPSLSAATAEVGLRTAPSFETLVALRPDLILTNALDAPIRPQLERVAPTLDNPTFTSARQPLANARLAVRLLGARIGRPREADELVADSDRRLRGAADRVGADRGRPLIPVQFADERHMTCYGAGSLYGDVLAALGLDSAYPGPTSLWGSATAEVASLGVLPPADLLLVAPVPAGLEVAPDKPGLLPALLAAIGRRLYRLPPVWAYGDVTAAARFGDVVADALTGGIDGSRGAWSAGRA